jgi:hypothetical protein
MAIARRAADAATRAKEYECGLRGPYCRKKEDAEQTAHQNLAAANPIPIEARPAIAPPTRRGHDKRYVRHPSGVRAIRAGCRHHGCTDCGGAADLKARAVPDDAVGVRADPRRSLARADNAGPPLGELVPSASAQSARALPVPGALH